MASSVPSPQDADYADRRAYPRVPVALPAFVQASGERYAAQLLDLSAGGARLNCPASPAVGTAVILDCGIISCIGVVRWQNGQALGICFDNELDSSQLSALTERSKALAALMKSRG